MDSDDEHALAAEDERIRRGMWRQPEKPAVFIKPFEEEEFAARRTRLVMAHHADRMGLPVDHHFDMGGMWRIRRLHASVLGFYKGDLDLAGRSERRWKSLQKHVDEFVKDVKRLRDDIVESPPMWLEEAGERVVMLTLASSKMQAFKDKYKLGYVDISETFSFPEMIQDAVSSGTGPIFQKVYIKDLPPELLLRVFDIIDIKDCRALGMACRAFHELSLTYVYMTRRLMLRVNTQYITKRFEQLSEADKRYLCQIKANMRSVLLADFQFLLSRPDILERIQKMQIENMWTEALQTAADIQPYQVPGVEHFFSPINREIVATLSMATHLQGFHLNNFTLTRVMLHAMASLNALRTLIVHACPIEELAALETLPVVPSVVNLTLAPGHVPGYEVVQLVALFPNMRYLTVAGRPKGGSCTLPFEEFRQAHNPFRTLERANFEHIDDEDVPVLFEWILAAGQATGLRLTHFRLELEYGLVRDELAQLLPALAGAPLRVLALEGVSHVDDDLFTRLAGAFPALTALTLIRRQNTRQTTSRPSHWPGTTAEYARRLAAFPALRHFVWNYYIWPLRCDTTYDLPLVEAGYPGELSEEDFEENCYEAKWDILPRLFRAYCPTLETLVFSLLHVALMEYTIMRSADGGIQWRYRERAPSEQFDKINPMLSAKSTPFENSWHVVPSREVDPTMSA